MYLHKSRTHYRRVRRFSGLFTDNPVLTMGLALPLAISATISLRAAFCVLVGVWCVTLPMVLLSSLVGGQIPRPVRIPLICLLSAVLLIPLERWLIGIFPVVINSLGLYLPIVSVNTLMLYLCDKRAIEKKPLAALWEAVRFLLGLSVVMMIAGGVREVFGYGAAWGISLPFMTFRLGGLLIPFSGCILIAFMAAFTKYAGRLFRARLYRHDVNRMQEKLASEAVPQPAEELVDRPLKKILSQEPSSLEAGAQAGKEDK